jgi:hypothetical protein
MAKVINTRNNGNPGIRYGEVLVNSKNVYPSTVTATATASTTAITLPLLDAYEFFTGVQTSAATDKIALPASAPVGTEIVIHAVSSFGVIKSGSDTINGVATIVTIAAAATAKILKVTSTAWVLTHIGSDGALTAPVV